MCTDREVAANEQAESVFCKHPAQCQDRTGGQREQQALHLSSLVKASLVFKGYWAS